MRTAAAAVKFNDARDITDDLFGGSEAKTRLGALSFVSTQFRAIYVFKGVVT